MIDVSSCHGRVMVGFLVIFGRKAKKCLRAIANNGPTTWPTTYDWIIIILTLFLTYQHKMAGVSNQIHCVFRCYTSSGCIHGEHGIRSSNAACWAETHAAADHSTLAGCLAAPRLREPLLPGADRKVLVRRLRRLCSGYSAGLCE